jgi:hypothetical protein
MKEEMKEPSPFLGITPYSDDWEKTTLKIAASVWWVLSICT